MKEKRNYVVYTKNLNFEEQERVIKMTKEQAEAIQWFMDSFDVSGVVELAENWEKRFYNGTNKRRNGNIISYF